MSQIRIMLDVILDDTQQARNQIQAFWDDLKSKRAGFKRIANTDEESSVEVHRCFHDETPSRPCVLKKKITLNTVEQEDDF